MKLLCYVDKYNPHKPVRYTCISYSHSIYEENYSLKTHTAFVWWNKNGMQVCFAPKSKLSINRRKLNVDSIGDQLYNNNIQHFYCAFYVSGTTLRAFKLIYLS